MKKLMTLALLALMSLGAQAEEAKDSAASNKPVFTIIKENPITSIKDQNRSGTCWDCHPGSTLPWRLPVLTGWFS